MKLLLKAGLSSILLTTLLMTSACQSNSKPEPSASPSTTPNPTLSLADDLKPANTPPAVVKNNGPKLSDILNKSKGTNNYYYEYTFKTHSNSLSYKIWIKDTKMRLEEASKVIFIDYEKREGYTILATDKSKAIRAGLPNVNNEFNPFTLISSVIGEPNLNQYQFVKKETFDKKSCMVFSSDTVKPKWSLHVWEDKGVLLKADVYSSSDNTLATTFEFKNFEIGKVTDEMVTLPKGTPITILNQ